MEAKLQENFIDQISNSSKVATGNSEDGHDNQETTQSQSQISQEDINSQKEEQPITTTTNTKEMKVSDKKESEQPSSNKNVSVIDQSGTDKEEAKNFENYAGLDKDQKELIKAVYDLKDQQQEF